MYDWSLPLKQRIERIAQEVYGADGVDYTPESHKQLALLQSRDDVNSLGVCMAKTHLSVSDDPAQKGAPKGWRLKIRDILLFGGAGFVVPVTGTISLMPGTGSSPAYRNIDVDVTTGRVSGIF